MAPDRITAVQSVSGIATDHSPYTHEEKLHDDIWQAISGFAGVETSVRLFLTYGVNSGRMTLEQFVRASSEGLAKAWSMYPRKGTIMVGSDADLTIVDLAREGSIREAELHGKNNLNPFEVMRHTVPPSRRSCAAAPRCAMVQLVRERGWGRLVSPILDDADGSEGRSH